MNNDAQPNPKELLAGLRIRHRQLDVDIEKLREENTANQLELQRLKRQKLKLKDQIQALENQQFPDIIA